MSYYRICPNCGAALDPGELCDCKEKAAQGATNTQDGKAETLTRDSTLIVPEREGDCQA